MSFVLSPIDVTNGPCHRVKDPIRRGIKAIIKVLYTHGGRHAFRYEAHTYLCVLPCAVEPYSPASFP